jgi:hypothetical protein
MVSAEVPRHGSSAKDAGMEEQSAAKGGCGRHEEDPPSGWWENFMMGRTAILQRVRATRRKRWAGVTGMLLVISRPVPDMRADAGYHEIRSALDST